jgi:hypothetical protein
MSWHLVLEFVMTILLLASFARGVLILTGKSPARFSRGAIPRGRKRTYRGISFLAMSGVFMAGLVGSLGILPLLLAVLLVECFGVILFITGDYRGIFRDIVRRVRHN